MVSSSKMEISPSKKGQYYLARLTAFHGPCWEEVIAGIHIAPIQVLHLTLREKLLYLIHIRTMGGGGGGVQEQATVTFQLLREKSLNFALYYPECVSVHDKRKTGASMHLHKKERFCFMGGGFVFSCHKLPYWTKGHNKKDLELFASRSVDARNKVPSGIKSAKTVNTSKMENRKNRERTWWKTPKIDQRRRQASGGTTSGTGLLRPIMGHWTPNLKYTQVNMWIVWTGLPKRPFMGHWTQPSST